MSCLQISVRKSFNRWRFEKIGFIMNWTIDFSCLAYLMKHKPILGGCERMSSCMCDATWEVVWSRSEISEEACVSPDSPKSLAVVWSEIISSWQEAANYQFGITKSISLLYNPMSLECRGSLQAWAIYFRSICGNFSSLTSGALQRCCVLTVQALFK